MYRGTVEKYDMSNVRGKASSLEVKQTRVSETTEDRGGPDLPAVSDGVSNLRREDRDIPIPSPPDMSFHVSPDICGGKIKRIRGTRAWCGYHGGIVAQSLEECTY